MSSSSIKVIHVIVKTPSLLPSQLFVVHEIMIARNFATDEFMVMAVIQSVMITHHAHAIIRNVLVVIVRFSFISLVLPLGHRIIRIVMITLLK